MLTLRNLFLSALLAGSWIPQFVQAAEPKVTGLRFPLGEMTGANPAARVNIEQLVQGAQKRGFFRVAILPILVVEGVTVQFLRPEITALKSFPETIQSIAHVDRFETHRLVLLAPNQPSPKLVAGDVFIHSPTDWTLKRVQIPAHAPIAECKLILQDGPEGGLHLPGGEHLSLSELFLLKDQSPETP